MTDLLRARSVDIHRDQCGDFPDRAEVIAERPRLTEASSRVSVRLNAKLEPRMMSDNYFCRATTTTFAGRPPS